MTNKRTEPKAPEKTAPKKLSVRKERLRDLEVPKDKASEVKGGTRARTT